MPNVKNQNIHPLNADWQRTHRERLVQKKKKKKWRSYNNKAVLNSAYANSICSSSSTWTRCRNINNLHLRIYRSKHDVSRLTREPKICLAANHCMSMYSKHQPPDDAVKKIIVIKPMTHLRLFASTHQCVVKKQRLICPDVNSRVRCTVRRHLTNYKINKSMSSQTECGRQRSS